MSCVATRSATSPLTAGGDQAAQDWWRGRLAVVTGTTGFVGAELAAALVERGAQVLGLDRNWDRADPLRSERLERLASHASFTGLALDLRDASRLDAVFRGLDGATVFHLAARPGVREVSLADSYADNVVATGNLLATLRSVRPAQVLFASSSSVYGRRSKLPFAEDAGVWEVASPYARSKLLGELAMARFQMDLGVPVTVARLFNVYGPRIRPDMAPSVIAKRILGGQKIVLAGGGSVERDLTFVGDAVEALLRLGEAAPVAEGTRTVNVGSGVRISMNTLSAMIEARLGIRALIENGPVHPLDLSATQADPARLIETIGWAPPTPLAVGLDRFAEWMLGHWERRIR